MAAYPGSIKAFTTHHDQTEDVMAGHVNSLQDEVVAIQTALGTSPQVDPTLNQQRVDYGTVRQRLETIQRGLDRPVCRVQRSASSQILTSSGAYVYIAWDSPAAYDPFGMFSSGTDVIIKRTGWYIITANANFLPNSTGSRQFVISAGIGAGTFDPTKDPWVAGNNGQAYSPATWGTLLNASTSGVFTKGQVIRVGASQSSGIGLGVFSDLELTFVRDT